jgi:hypothetical protein
MKSIQATLILAGFGILVSCSGNDAESEKIKQEIKTDISSYDSEDEDFVLPPFMSVAKSFQAAGLEYVPGKTNPVKNKKEYSLKVKQLLNMGVYCTDLAYCSLNGKTQAAREYLKVIQELGNEVGLGSVFSDKEMIEKFDKNLNNEEASEDFIYELQERSEDYLQSNDMKYIASVQFAGAWVEGMYLGAEEALEKADVEIIGALVDQMSLLENTIKGLKAYPDKDDLLKQLIADLEETLVIYSNLDNVKKAGKNRNLNMPALSKSDLMALKAQIEKMRTGIVSVN